MRNGLMPPRAYADLRIMCRAGKETQAMHELLTATEVQNLFDVDRSTIYRMASDGRIPAVKIGRQWRFPAVAIEQLVALPSRPHEPIDVAPDVAERLLELAAEALGVMMVVTDTEGRPITPIVNPCPRFAAIQDDPEAVKACAEEWRTMAESPDPRPQFRRGVFDFLCARSFVRVDGHTEGMVLAGGVAPDGEEADDLFVLSPEQRRLVVSSLPKVAGLLSRFDQRSRT